MSEETVASLLRECMSFLCQYGLKYDKEVVMKGSLELSIDGKENIQVDLNKVLQPDESNTSINDLDDCFRGKSQKLQITASMHDPFPSASYVVSSSRFGSRKKVVISGFGSKRKGQTDGTETGESPEKKRTKRISSPRKAATVSDSEGEDVPTPSEATSSIVCRSGRRSIKTPKFESAMSYLVKKARKTEEILDDDEDEDEKPVRRGRGRPRKYDSEVTGELGPIKRGRGRPRKYVMVPQDDDTSKETDSEEIIKEDQLSFREVKVDASGSEVTISVPLDDSACKLEPGEVAGGEMEEGEKGGEEEENGKADHENTEQGESSQDAEDRKLIELESAPKGADKTDEDEDDPLVSKREAASRTRAKGKLPLKKNQCKHCRKIFLSNTLLVQHLKKHKYACRKCDAKYTHIYHLEAHVKSVHDGIRYQCSKCEKLFPTRDSLYNHFRGHRGFMRKCPVKHCVKEFIGKQKLGNHLASHCRQDLTCPFGCKYEGDERRNTALLREHMRTHLAASDWESYCAKCTRTFANKEECETHEKECDGKWPELDMTNVDIDGKRIATATDTPRYQCEICYKTFARVYNLRDHMSVVHEKRKCPCDKCEKVFDNMVLLRKHKKWHDSLTCRYLLCDQFFNNEEELNKHMETHDADNESLKPAFSLDGKKKVPRQEVVRKNQLEKQNVKTITEDGKTFYECPSCQRKLGSWQSFNNHMKYHTGQVFKCNQCPKFYNRLLRLRTHVERVHMNIRHSCAECGKLFRSREALTSHMRWHTGKNLHYCHFEGCDKVYETRTSLKVHLRTHTGERPYICEICGADFATAPTLILHVRRHDKKNQFECEIEGCTSKFYEKSQYKKHLLKHEGKLSHFCTTCGKGFVLKCDAIKHERICGVDRSDYPYECQICKRRYKYNNGALRHAYKAHGIIPKKRVLLSSYSTGVAAEDESLVDEQGKETEFTLDGTNIKLEQAGGAEVQEFIIAPDIVEEALKGDDGQNVVMVQTEGAVEVADAQTCYMCSICQQVFVSHEDYNNHMLSHINGTIPGFEEGTKIIFLTE